MPTHQSAPNIEENAKETHPQSHAHLTWKLHSLPFRPQLLRRQPCLIHLVHARPGTIPQPLLHLLKVFPSPSCPPRIVLPHIFPEWPAHPDACSQGLRVYNWPDIEATLLTKEQQAQRDADDLVKAHAADKQSAHYIPPVITRRLPCHPPSKSLVLHVPLAPTGFFGVLPEQVGDTLGWMILSDGCLHHATI